MRLARKHGSPVIPFGVGTSLEGHVAAMEGGVSIDMGRMNRVVEVNAEDLDVLVEAGVTRKQLNNYLRDQGLFFPIDPGADATLGGMASTRASGTNAVRYGTMRENVLGLTVVTADGRIMKTGGRARKSAAGYDLTRLFVGSEGTLGVITEVRLRLYGIPETMAAAVTPFPTIADAVEHGDPRHPVRHSGRAHRAAGRGPDEAPATAIPSWTMPSSRPCSSSSTAARRRRGAGRAGEGDRGGLRRRRVPLEREAGGAHQAVAGAARRLLCRHVDAARLEGLADRCLRADLAPRRLHRRDQRKDIEASGLLATILGHVGDGNFHTTILVDPNDPAELKRAEAFNDRLVDRALAMGGTCTGEHGIGFGKIALPGARAWRGGRPDAADQADARSGEPDESGEDFRS